MISGDREARQSKQSNEQEESSSEALRTESGEFEIGGDDCKRIEPDRNWLSRNYPELITVVLIGCFISGAFDYLGGPTDEELRETTIATEKTIGVLSFSVDRQGADDETASRIAEDLAALLKEVPELQVTNDFQFQSDSWELVGAREVRQRLKVNFIVLGKVHEKSDHVNVSVAVFDLANRRHIDLRNNYFVENHSEIPQMLTSIRTSIL